MGLMVSGCFRSFVGGQSKVIQIHPNSSKIIQVLLHVVLEALAKALRENSTIKQINLKNNKIGPKGRKARPTMTRDDAVLGGVPSISQYVSN